MSIDIKQFFNAFYDECIEALQTMESGLLQLDSISDEGINGLFRAAHSIKGGAGTFGFNTICDFTHNVETLLDSIRRKEIHADKNTTNILLEACDCIRILLDSEKNEVDVDHDRIESVNKNISSIVQNTSNTNVSSTISSENAGNHEYTYGWSIYVNPQNDAFVSGFDPLGLVRALSDLGPLTISADISELPDIRSIDPHDSYINWHIKLNSNIQQSEINDVIDWVTDHCNFQIESINNFNESQIDDHQNDCNYSEEIIEQPDVKNTDITSSRTSSVRVETSKIDQLINMVGELVITQSMLQQIGDEMYSKAEYNSQLVDRLRSGLQQLERHTRELQQKVMSTRMVPISYSFSRFPRLVHDLSIQLEKEIDLDIRGETTEIDKTLIENLSDPLLHMIRNALDHGIESPDDRIKNGKNPTGSITLEARHKGGNIVIEIRDDGRGLDADKMRAKAELQGIIGKDTVLSDKQALELVFEPGFSTAEHISDLSGRGVGMDVVRNNVQALGGDIELESEPGMGTVFRIILPLTLAILDGQTVSVGSDLFVIPLAAILESIQIKDKDIRRPADAIELIQWRDEQLPLIRLHSIFNSTTTSEHTNRGLVVIVEGGGYRAGLTVSDLMSQQQVVIKSLDENFRKVDGFSGATILGDGTVALILDIAGIIKLSGNGHLPYRLTGKEYNYGYEQ